VSRKHQEATRLILEMVPAVGEVGAPEGNGNAAKDEKNKVDMSTLKTKVGKARLRIRSLPNPQSTWSTEEQPPAGVRLHALDPWH